jgi:cytoskeleton protein RodZ
MSQAELPVPVEVGPGQMLARQRLQQRLSVEDVAKRLKYSARQIEALEAEEFSRLPGTTFVRGIMRSYAKLLEIDPAPLMAALDRRHIPSAVTVDLRSKPVPFPDGVKRGTRLYLVLSVVLLVGVLAVLVEWQTGGLARLAGTSEPTSASNPPAAEVAEASAPVAQPSEPQVSPPAAATLIAAEGSSGPRADAKASPAPRSDARTASAPSASRADTKPAPVVRVSAKPGQPLPAQARLVLRFEDESWVEIKDREGKTLLAQLNPGGSRRTVSGQPPFSVVIGNAHEVRLSYNETPVDLKPHVKVEVARFTLE